MDPAVARAQLLREHERLRELIAAAVAAAHAVRRGEPEQAELDRALEELRLAFAAHNASEEAALVPLLEQDPAWGPARIARMLEEHLAEHAAVRAALAGPGVADELDDLAEDIDAHMAAEERTFLSPAVLR